MSVDSNTVKRVAHLARISVSDAEAEALRGELNAILGFVEQLNEVDVSGVEPMTSVLPMAMKMREDQRHRRREGRCDRRQRAPDGGQLLPGPEGGRMIRRSTRARHFCVLLLSLAAQPVLAAGTDAFITGTYSTPDGCDALAQNDKQSDALYLTATGITGGEFHCDFVNVAARSGDPGWVATALCEEPGLSYPELISILPLEDKRLQLFASQIADVDVGGDYQRCDAGSD